MSRFSETLKKIKSEELLSRFRSKEDLYKYMTNQSNNKLIFSNYPSLVGLFLPSLKSTRLSFIRAILSNEKKALRQQDIIASNVPQYEELSVKNLYQDAMKDETLKEYLPDLVMNSNRFPERKFFFGILGTIKHDYLKQIILDANANRFNINDIKQQEDYITIDDAWYQELIKYPYISKKPGKAIYLIKQRSKLYRNKKIHNKFEISQRIIDEMNDSQYKQEQNNNRENKRQKLDGNIFNNVFQEERQSLGIQFNI